MIRSPRLKAILKSGGLLLFGLGLALVMLELTARLLHLGTGGFWQPDPYVGWRNIPNAQGWESCFGECEIYVEINSLGLRDREIGYQAAAGERRILFLGDSTTAGMQVSLEQTYVKRLEQALNGAGSGNWVTINAAVNGYGTDNELLFYRQEAGRYEADLVVVGVYLANDVYNNSRELDARTGGSRFKPYFELDGNGQLLLQNYPVEGLDAPAVRFSTFLKRYFQLPRFVAQVLSLRTQGQTLLSSNQATPTPVPAGSPPPAPTTENRLNICASDYAPKLVEAWEVTKALLQQLETEVAANGQQLAVLIIPAQPQTVVPAGNAAWYCDRPNQELAAFLESEQIPYLDPLPAFRDHVQAGGEPLYFERDFHHTAAGHQLLAESLLPFVLDLLNE